VSSTPIIPDFLLPPNEIDPQNIKVNIFLFSLFSSLVSLGQEDFWKGYHLSTIIALSISYHF